MHLATLTLFAVGFSTQNAAATAVAAENIVPALDAVTNNVAELTVHPYERRHSPPSSQHLARRRSELVTKRQNAQEDLISIGGRIYITNVTLGGKPFSLVIDSGSSDTWVASSNFKCEDPKTYATLPVQQCGFGAGYNVIASSTYRPMHHNFTVNYTGGEFLLGDMGTEVFGIGGVSRGKSPYITARQTIGVVNEGFWYGDAVSSGLMGLGFPALAKGINTGELNYTSVIYTLFKDPTVSPVFSLALNRPTTAAPRAGGLLAIGGIPNIANDGKWIQVPIQPYIQGLYAFYSININGYDITPPVLPKTTVNTTPKRVTVSYATSKQSMILDSGTSLLFFPDVVATYIASLFVPPARYIANTNSFIVSCTALVPRVGVIIGGRTFFISEDDLMNRGPGAVGGASFGAAKGECVVAVQKALGGTLVLGDTWLRNVLVVFDVANATDVGVGGSDRDRNGAGAVRIVGREKY